VNRNTKGLETQK